MQKEYSLLLLLITFILTTGCSKDTSDLLESSPEAPLFENMGSHTYKISTSSGLAQRYFDQGLNLTHGFNHAEAGRSFMYAAGIDPGCAMCYWGAAYVLGPNINSAMEESSVLQAYDLTQKALNISKKGTEKERDLINALSKRYGSRPIDDRSSFDLEYANAMRTVAKKYPEDAEILSLFAESLMDLHPWNYWRSDGNPHPWTPEILEALEKAIVINENHPLANHLYIHAVEASPNPQKAIPSADRLGSLVPDAGHLVHMPSHIYIRVGRYKDASWANKKAIESDESYVSQCHAQGVYPLAYKPHNIHFLWASSTLEGRSDMAIKSAWDLAGEVDQEMMTKPGLETLQHFYITPLYAMVKFGKWEEILQQPPPSENLVYPRGVWNYAMG
jgi:tetratricopeptide (TPR) repeat protein